MGDAVTHAPHEGPVGAEQAIAHVRFEGTEGFDAGRQAHADGIDHDLVVEVVFGVGQHDLEVGEGVAQDLVGLPAHSATASPKARSRTSGRRTLSGTRSTFASSRSLSCCSSAPSCIRLSGVPMVNSRSMSESSWS